MKHKTIYKLLTILADGQFHSGEKLGQSLGITRSAIWKNIRELEKIGVDIQSITGKGYRIAGGLELLNQADILKELSSHSRKSLDQIEVFDSIDSTNDYLLQIARFHQQQSIACFAEHQTAGKGRRKRHWCSPFGTNLYFSLLWNFQKDPAEIVGLSIIIGIAITQALQRYGISDAIAIKWPNDVLWQHKKLAGILIETFAENHGNCSAVIGVGLNTEMSQKQASPIQQPWTSIHSIMQQKVKRNQLAGLLLDELIKNILLFDEKGFKIFQQKWQTLDYLFGKPIVIQLVNQKIHGTMQGIGQSGELILRNEKQQLQQFQSGEVSVRIDPS